MKLAPFTKVRARRTEEYDAVHREVPEELTAADRGGAMITEPGTLPGNLARRARTATLLDVVHGYGDPDADASLPVVWEL
ncbi:hypothetical protein [Streptomyces sp. NRRL B-3229]|uniref:hypothetical protein n=1 Tax=Streptomyces sp. NRRL B-3229 TaxID=1463836 RepID=UPI0004BF7787|nr:hypothetical protein [Streptomyces sp. NRRL B-3229]